MRFQEVGRGVRPLSLAHGPSALWKECSLVEGVQSVEGALQLEPWNCKGCEG